MQQTWRWFGPKDPISLNAIREAGATGIVTALHDIPGGTAWDDAAIAERKGMIAEAGLTWSVVESVPVTNAVKARGPERQRHIEAWKETLRGLGRAGIGTVCYNFMPIVDWTRTDLAFPLKSGLALRFDRIDFVAYDVFILGRTGADDDYDVDDLAEAQARFRTMSEARKVELERIILAGLPGSDFAYDRAGFLDLLKDYAGMGPIELRDSLKEFLREVVPVAEEWGIRLAIHPDDPPLPLFGLPRIVSTGEDIEAVLEMAESPANGLTFCVGSYGARADNDLPGMIGLFVPRIHFLHLRNVTREERGSFHEAEHLDGDADMVAIVAAIRAEERRRQAEGRTDSAIPMRPDHGHLLSADPVRNTNPGYSYLGRLKGLAELRGIERAVDALAGH